MENLENIQIQDMALKREKLNKVIMYIHALIRNTELSKMLKNKKFTDEQQVILNRYDYYTGFDALTCDDDMVTRVLSERAGHYLEHRKKVVELKRICQVLPSISEISSLHVTDKTHIYLLANKIYPSVIFDRCFFYNADLKIPIEDWYNNSWTSNKFGLADIKSVLKPILHHMLGLEGDMFYGIKISKKSITYPDLRRFLFSMDNYKKLSIRKPAESYKPYKPYKAFTELCSTILYDNCIDHEICFPDSSRPQIMKIGPQDFLIKCNVFQCMHKSHKIENIIGLIKIQDEEGQIEQVKILAGYCRECNIFFVLKSVYQHLDRMGIILCKVIDEKQYIKGHDIYGYNLNQQSVLMQYGYNVAQINGIPDEKRHDILAFIIDNNILSKSEVISYLDFFINQRKYMENMKCAVSKWENDRAFVVSYNNEEYREIEVKSLHKQ